MRNYVLDEDNLVPDFDSALGIMRQRELRVLRRGSELLEMTPEIMAFLKEPRPLIIAKANIHARVHRRVYLDYIGVKHFDAAGNLVGEQRIVGLFTSTAYTRSAHGIPYLRRKLASVESRAGFDPGSHSGKALANVLEHYPRDELFQVDEPTLYQNAIAILQLDERPRVRVLPRRDRFDRFVSVLVYVPRERYDSDIRAKIGDLSRLDLRRPRLGLLSLLPGRTAGARALHHRPVRGRADRHSARQAGRAKSAASSGPGPTASPTRWRSCIRQRRRASSMPAIARRSRQASAMLTRRPSRPATFASSKA